MDGHESTARQRRPGRPIMGADLIAAMDTGSPIAKRRLEAILRTLDGTWTIEEACAHVKVKRSAFFKLRMTFLQRAIALLEPQKPGPKPGVPFDPDHVEVRALRSEVAGLEIEVLKTELDRDLARAATSSDEEIVETPVRSRGKKRRRRKSR